MALLEIRAGKTVRIPYTFRDATAPDVTYTNPIDITHFGPTGPPFYDPTDPTMTIYDPKGTIIVAATPMVEDSVTTVLIDAKGHFHHDFETPANGRLGVWKSKSDATDTNATPSGSGEPDECFRLIAP